MDFHSLISLGLDKTLRCFVCINYLSYFPISLCSNNQSLCGRCAVPEGLISFQDEVLETICQFLKFPCRYQSDGCPEELTPGEVPEHEKTCPFRTVHCIMNKKQVQCNWKGSLPSLLQHCRTEHSDLIMLENSKYTMNLLGLARNEYNGMLVHNDVLLILTMRFDSTTDILTCSLYNHEYAVNPESCSAQLSIKNCNRTLLLDLKATEFTEMIFTELTLHCIRGGDKQNSLQFRVNIGDTQSEDRLDRVRNATLLSLLKCWICSEFALPPIYRCVKNTDAICSDCRHKHEASCFICTRSTTCQKSNSNLNTIAHLLAYSCKYKKKGCTTVLKYQQMGHHHNVCAYGNDECPFFKIFNATCEWKGLKRDVNDHVLSNHRQLVANASDELEFSENDKTACKFIPFLNRLFLLTYWIDSNGTSFAWRVQPIGCCTEKIKYEIDIVDGSNSGRRMLKREFCNDHSGTYITYFEKNQISDFLIIKNNAAVVKFRVSMFT